MTLTLTAKCDITKLPSLPISVIRHEHGMYFWHLFASLFLFLPPPTTNTWMQINELNKRMFAIESLLNRLEVKMALPNDQVEIMG